MTDQPFVIVRNMYDVKFRQTGTDEYPLPAVNVYRDMHTRGTLEDHIHYNSEKGFDLYPQERCWKVPADQVLPGQMYRSLGCGYIAREVIRVSQKCNCQWGSRSIDPKTREPLHHQVRLLECESLNSYVFPGSLVTLTTGRI